MTPSPPQSRRLGRYELVARLAVGGMAEVFLAREVGPAGLERPVVVKRILPHLAEDPEFVQLFLQEARVVARLSHPNIVQIHELGEVDGAWFIAMEYVPGVTLRQLAKAATRLRRPVPCEVAVAIFLQACDGAHAAHELCDASGKLLGLVHRDISPQNLMVSDDGHVKLLDFGIAKATAESEATRTGMLKGKTSYLSPEQCRQEPLDRRSDVFALGIVLWELVVGEPLFKRETEFLSFQAIDKAKWVDPRERRPDVPAALAEVLKKALARRREDRFPTADALRLALARVADDAGWHPTRDAVKAFVGEVVGDRRREDRLALERAYAGGELLPAPTERRLGGGDGESVTALERRRAPPRERRGIAPGILAIVVLLVGALVWFAERSRGPALHGPPVVVGFAPTIDPKVIRAELDPLRTYLESRLGRPFRFVVAPSYEKLLDELESGRTSFAMLTPYLLLEARGKDPKVEPLATYLYDGSPGNDGVVLVSDGSQANSLADLKGRKVCLTDPDSTTGYVLPRAALARAGLDLTTDVTVVMSGNHLQAMRDLEAGRCDAAATFDKAYLAADRAGVKSGRLRMLANTGRAPNDTICAGPKVDPKVAAAMRTALLSFQPQRDVGEPLLGKVERISGFAAVDDHAFAALQAAVGAQTKPGR